MTVTGAQRVHLAAALDGAGWHPAAWREPDARPADLLTAGYWADQIAEAERGLLDFVTIEDGLALQSDDRYKPDQRTDRVRGRLDAVLIAARVAPLTSGIGLIPTVTVTHTEPFHISKAIATLDWVSSGRAGVRVKVSAREDEAAHIGRRTFPAGPELITDLFAEAADYVEVVRRLWDSWEDDAEIRDVATGRFVDTGKLHYIDFEGRWFSVKGPSITPRPPQGQPAVAALAHRDVAYQLLASSADIGFITPRDRASAAGIVAEVREAEARQADAEADRTGPGRAGPGRAGAPVRLFADLLVYLDGDGSRAAQRKARLDDRAGAAYRSDALTFTGTAAELADLIQDWQSAGLTGFRLRPAAIPHDLTQITRALVPELRRRGTFPSRYEEPSLRARLGLSRPASRYATA
ncbi:MAG TPA: LLM class flavin-dependent oxidoreductase [Streptosporangiaceae bacterium]|jgi:alkanesulfonate monooxygenase SsuD/methylene tetrahydromethanopterin reductase-like flavin-dependent oxidoreductase (luciferase family)|nr:LLM class flavin-dependent oxidoreductase [Streptosporangiaceae bacterium]